MNRGPLQVTIAVCFAALLMGMTPMSDEQSPPIRLVVERRDGTVEATLIGQPGQSGRYLYALEVSGASRSRHAASYVEGRSPKEINRTRFPDKPPWRIEFRISDHEGHLVHEQTLSDHG